MRTFGGERGAVLVVVAVAMPVFLLLMALIVDSGNWFTHNRQLRTRADAAVHAAGLEYARQWARCTSGNALQKIQAQTAIVDAAKDYAGRLHNAEIADVDPVLDIVVNLGIPTPLCGAVPTTSTEVKVSERNIDSLFASFGIPIGQTSASARVELLRAASETGFVPLAIEDQRIVKAQARFFNGCDPPATRDEIGGPVNLTRIGSTTLWRSEAQITLPSATNPEFGCGAGPGEPGRDYEPVSVELRLASREDVDLNASCAALIAAPFADCFADITQFRTFACRNKPPPANDFPAAICVGEDSGAGTNGPNDPPDVYGVSFSGPTCAPDPYYARLPTTASSCTFAASVYMNWFDRPPGVCEADLVLPGRAPYPLTGPCPRPTESGDWIATGVELASPGHQNVRINWRWRSVEDGGGWTCAPPAPPCNESGSFVVHRTNLADDPATDSSPTDIVQLIKVTDDPTGATQVHSKHADGQTHLFYVTAELKSELAPGRLAGLRTRFPGNRALVCDPDYLGGQTETMVAEGCKPPFGANALDRGFWWSGTACPSYSAWFTAPYLNTPWRCLRTEEQTSGSAEQLADGIAARTGNCSTTPGCGVVQCNTPNRYSEYFEAMSSPIDLTDRRFVPVFVLPFGSLKGPADNAVPILEIAYFYVTGWGAAGGNPGDPCPGADSARPGRVAGHFVSTVRPNTGPTEPSPAPCSPIALRPCRAVLVR